MTRKLLALFGCSTQKIHAWYEYDLSQCELSAFKRLKHEWRYSVTDDEGFRMVIVHQELVSQTSLWPAWVNQ